MTNALTDIVRTSIRKIRNDVSGRRIIRTLGIISIPLALGFAFYLSSPEKSVNDVISKQTGGIGGYDRPTPAIVQPNYPLQPNQPTSPIVEPNYPQPNIPTTEPGYDGNSD